MGDLGDALFLLCEARDRFRTVRAVMRERVDGPLAAQAKERFAASPEGRAWGFDSEDRPRGADERELRMREGVLRLWVEKPDRVRVEFEGDLHGAGTSVRDGRRWWSYHPDEGVDSNEDDLSVGSGIGDEAELLLDPSPLLAALRFEPRGGVEVAGRAAIALGARKRDGADLDFVIGQLGLGSDAYELAVDRERGILLRIASLIDGAEFAVSEVLEVAFDEDFPAETFVLTAPEGVARNPIWGTPPEEVTIEEAARRAAFPIWYPREISADWQVTVGYVSEDPARGERERVHIRIWRKDATHHVSIVESSSTETEPDEEDWEWMPTERDGFAFELAESEHGPISLRFQHEGTSIRLSSDLDLDALVTLARDLRQV